MSHIFLLDTGGRRRKRVEEGKNSNIEARISKQIRISNGQNSKRRLTKGSFRSFDNSELGIVSDFGFRNSNLIIGLAESIKIPGVQRPIYG